MKERICIYIHMYVCIYILREYVKSLRSRKQKFAKYTDRYTFVYGCDVYTEKERIYMIRRKRERDRRV